MHDPSPTSSPHYVQLLFSVERGQGITQWRAAAGGQVIQLLIQGLIVIFLKGGGSIQQLGLQANVANMC